MAGTDALRYPDSERTPAGHESPGLDQRFDRNGLTALRAAVAAHGDRLGIGHDQLTDLLLIAHEMASNAIQHGGGRGRLRLWRAGDMAYCLVEDWGGNFAAPAAAGLLPPTVGAPSGRGLWLVRQLADEVSIDARSNGTAVTASLRLDGVR